MDSFQAKVFPFLLDLLSILVELIDELIFFNLHLFFVLEHKIFSLFVVDLLRQFSVEPVFRVQGFAQGDVASGLRSGVLGWTRDV